MSHKGENGKVAIVGGSEYMHGAPILSALAAEASGVDLVYVCVPKQHAESTKQASLNFQVHPFAGGDLAATDIDHVLELLATVDYAVVGPGIGRGHETIRHMQNLLESSTCPLVLDATALQPWSIQTAAHRQCVLTPHLGELERMGVDESALPEHCMQQGVTVHVKGPVDRTYTATGDMISTSGGHAGLTVGGTGDVLAGLIAGLCAQHLPPTHACHVASQIIKRAGTLLARTHGYAYTAHQVVSLIPQLLLELSPANA